MWRYSNKPRNKKVGLKVAGDLKIKVFKKGRPSKTHLTLIERISLIEKQKKLEALSNALFNFLSNTEIKENED